MKNLLILSMLTIFFFACKDEGEAGPQEEEVIEEIIYTVYKENEGFTCDTLILKSDSSLVIFKTRCENNPNYIEKFYNEDVLHFIDTLVNRPELKIDLKYKFEDIFDSTALKFFYDLPENSTHNIFNSIVNYSFSIKTITNKQEKIVNFNFKRKNEYDIIDSLLLKLFEIREYHVLRLANKYKG